MSWPFQTLRILYPVLTLFSLTIISLLSAWVSSANSIKLPAEIILGFIFSIISFLFTASLSFPTISRRFGYNVFVYSTDIILSIFWFLLSILIVARVNDGSIIDSKILTDQLNKEGLSLGTAITVLSWIQFITHTFTAVLLTRIRSRKWAKKDRNKRITIVGNHYDQDAKMLNTPAIMKEIDELVKNPQTAQPTKEPSSKSPVLELNIPLTTNTTTLYSLDPVSSTPTQHNNSEDDFYSRALYDYNK